MRLASPLILFCLIILLLSGCGEKVGIPAQPEGEVVKVLKEIHHYSYYEHLEETRHSWVKFDYDDRRRAVLKSEEQSFTIFDLRWGAATYFKPVGTTMKYRSANSAVLRRPIGIEPQIRYYTYSTDGKLFQELWDEDGEGRIIASYRYFYDKNGWLISKSNEFFERNIFSFESRWRYNDEGRVREVLDLMDELYPYKEECDYNENGKLRQVVRTNYDYTTKNELTVKTGPWVFYSYDYDSAGRVVRKNQSNLSRCYEYDKAGKLLVESYRFSDGTPYKYGYIYYNTYDSYGNLIKKEKDEAGDGSVDFIELYFYDSQSGLLLNELDFSLESKDFSYARSYSYDNQGDLIEIVEDRGADGEPDDIIRYTYEEIELTD